MDSKELLQSLNFCVIDLETTGGNPETDEIIEIGMVKISKLKIIKETNYLLDPGIKIPDFIQKLTSIKQKDVKGCPKFSEVVDEILDFIGDDIIVAHNISFDFPFLDHVIQRYGGQKLTNKSLCTNVMTKHMIPEIMSSNLNYMSKLFGIQHSNAHRAYDDAMATAKLLLKFLEIFKDKGIKKVNHLYYPRNKFELDRLHFGNSDSSTSEILKEVKKHDTPLLVTLKGERGVILNTLPTLSGKKNADFIEEELSKSKWERVTIKMIHPLLEGLNQLSAHYQKLTPQKQKRVLSFMEKQILGKKKKLIDSPLNQYDFIVSHHLVKDQVVVHSFLNTGTKKAIFKIPGQRKKMLNYLRAQMNRFENQQKKRKHISLPKEIIPLYQHYISDQVEKGLLLHITREQVKSHEQAVFDVLGKFNLQHQKLIHFPADHL